MTTRKTLSLPAELVDWLEAEADQRVLGRNKLAELLLEDGLAHLPPMPPPPPPSCPSCPHPLADHIGTTCSGYLGAGINFRPCSCGSRPAPLPPPIGLPDLLAPEPPPAIAAPAVVHRATIERPTPDAHP